MMHVAQYPARTADSGDFDICGFEKPQLGYKKVVLGSEETFLVSYDPRVHDKVELLGRYGWGRCEHSWSWPVEEGAPIKVEVYSAAPCVEVFVNDVSIGKAPAGEEQDFRAVFETTYVPGKVCAVSYDEEGNEISRDEVSSVGKPVGTRILEDEILVELRDMGVLPLDEESVSYKVIEVVDENGNFVPYGEMKVTAEELGLQNVIALGSGRPTTEENYTSGEITTYRGRALAICK
jgi:beta-galactosidase